MKKTFKKVFILLVVCLVVFAIIEIPTGFFRTKIYVWFVPPNSLIMKFSVYPDGYTAFCADGFSPVLLDVTLYDSNHNPVPYSLIKVTLNHFSATVDPDYPVTDRNGRVMIKMIPEEFYYADQTARAVGVPEGSVSVELTAKKSVPARWEGKIVPLPVLLVHGFQDTSESMVPLKNYLSGKGFMTYVMDYATDTDIETMSEELNRALSETLTDIRAKGIWAGRADIVAHSLGGVVTRYYTTNRAYIEKQNVHKLVFINVPHHGTPWAEAGAAFLDSPFLKELYPTSTLYTGIFPNAINKGLNHNLQTANIALENDEVVPLPSAMLVAWGIETRIYRIGIEPLSLGSVINNQMTGESRHRQILFYTPVFEEIYDNLTNNLSYPQKIK